MMNNNKFINIISISIILSILLFLSVPKVIASNDNVNNINRITITGFTVIITANVSGIQENEMNFTGKSGLNIYPDGTNNGTNRWGYILNTGTTKLSFLMSSPTPANITLKVDAKSNMKNAFKVTSSPGHPSGKNWNGWQSVLPGESANIFAIAIFNSKAIKAFNIPVEITVR